jgi:hypothetical protein
MWCSNCGSELPGRARFCPVCAVPVARPDAAASSASPEPLAPSSPPRSGPGISATVSVPKKGRRWLWMVVVGAAIIVAAAAVGTYFLIRAAGTGADGLSEDAVARVGKADITQEEFDKSVQEVALQYQFASKQDDPVGWAQLERDTLEQLVVNELAVQKAKEYGLRVTDNEVQTEIAKTLADYFGGDQNAFDAALADINMTTDQLEPMYRESILVQKVYDKVTNSTTEMEKEGVWNEWVTETKAELGVVYRTGMEPTATTITTAGFPRLVSPNLHGEVDDLLKTAGTAAAIAYISDSVRIGDSFLGVEITDIDLWVEGQGWVIGDGTSQGGNYDLSWYNDAGEVVAKLLFSG